MLKRNYKENDAVRSICDHMAGRAKNQNETALHRLIHYFEKEGLDFKRSDLIAAFRLLEGSECGKYVEGRHGWKSRFVWAVRSKFVAGAAQGIEAKVDLASEEEFDEGVFDEEMLEHTYILRPNFVVVFELPVDLTRREVQRLSQFVESLSFEGDAGDGQ